MPANFSEMGLSGLNHTAGIVDEEFLPRLKGQKFFNAMSEMRDNDPVCGSILFAIDMLVRQSTWTVEGKDDKRKKLIEEAKDDMSLTWADTISEILSMLVFGFSFHEIVYKKREGDQEETAGKPTSKFNDGKIGWRKFAVRAQESLVRWEFDEQGGLDGFTQRPAPKYEEITIPMLKGLLFRTSTYKNNPMGRSVFRTAFRPWYFKKRIEQIEAVGIERDLAGMPIAFVDPMILREDADAPSKALKNSIYELVKNVKRDELEGIVFPQAVDANGNKLYDFQLMSASGSRQFDTGGIIQRKNQEIAMTVLADFILLGHEKTGSFALSADKTELFGVALMAWLQAIADVLNQFAIPRLLRLNGMTTEDPPKFVPSEVETPPLGEFGQLISALAGAGMPLFPDEDLEQAIREKAKLPEKKKDSDAEPQQGKGNKAQEEEQQDRQSEDEEGEEERLRGVARSTKGSGYGS